MLELLQHKIMINTQNGLCQFKSKIISMKCDRMFFINLSVSHCHFHSMSEIEGLCEQCRLLLCLCWRDL